MGQSPVDPSARVEVIVGRVGRAHGLAGESYVDLTTDSPRQRFAVGAQVRAVTGPVRSAGVTPGRDLTVTGFRHHGGRGIVGFAEIADRAQAEALTGTTLVALVAAMEAAGRPDEYFDHQLVGLRAQTPGDQDIGRVVGVEHAGFQDNLVVELADGQRRVVPFVGPLVPLVDLASGHIVIEPIPGLLSDEGGA